MSTAYPLAADVRLYDWPLRSRTRTGSTRGSTGRTTRNRSLQVLTHCKLEPSLKDLEPGERVQFDRVGYFVVDTRDSKPGAPVFNRTVPLRDSWAKLEKKLQAGGDSCARRGGSRPVR